MKRFATLIAAAAIAATVPLAANADSYVNSNLNSKSHASQSYGAQSYGVTAQGKSSHVKKTVRIRPASKGKTFNFGSYSRDTSKEGYGPNGGR